MAAKTALVFGFPKYTTESDRRLAGILLKAESDLLEEVRKVTFKNYSGQTSHKSVGIRDIIIGTKSIRRSIDTNKAPSNPKPNLSSSSVAFRFIHALLTESK